MSELRSVDPEQARLLVVVAHPDDETFGCGSLLAHVASRGQRTMVVCATRGEAGTPAPGFLLNGATLAQVREDELRAAAALLGVERVELLPWRDSGMDGEPERDSLVAAPLDEVASAVAAIIDDWEPHTVVTLDGSDGHRDHVHVRDATLAACESSRWRPRTVYLHCLPQRLMREWVQTLASGRPDSEYLALGDLGTPDEQITTVIDTSKHLALRERAIAAHRSQTSPYEVMSTSLRREFLSAERLRRVHPAWPGGSIESELS